MEQAATQQFLTLEDIQKQKEYLKSELLKNEDEIALRWHSLFTSRSEGAQLSPTHRLSNMANICFAAIDGLILSWKLYKKYRKGVAFFRRKRR